MAAPIAVVGAIMQSRSEARWIGATAIQSRIFAHQGKRRLGSPQCPRTWLAPFFWPNATKL